MRSTVLLAVAMTMAFTGAGWCQQAPLPGGLPASLPAAGRLGTQSATLLAGATLQEGLAIGVYGPRLPGSADALRPPGEPLLLTVLVQGNQTVNVRSGVVLLACRHGAATMGDTPAAGQYIPHGQWAPGQEGSGGAASASEWRQLLTTAPQSLWALRLSLMSPPEEEASAGRLLDLTALAPDWPTPPRGSVFSNYDEYDQYGAAFVSEEASAGDHPQAAHGVQISFPVVLNDPRTSLMLWAAMQVVAPGSPEGKVLTQTLLVTTTGQAGATKTPQATGEAPQVDKPEDAAPLGDGVTVQGKSKPGTLVVGWLEYAQDETAGPGKSGQRVQLAPARQLTGGSGSFSFVLSAGPAGGQNWELHVRAEAPGYKSPETVRKLKR